MKYNIGIKSWMIMALLMFSFSQKENNETLQFNAGAAVLSKNEFDRLINKPTINGLSSCERAQIPGNKDHGNMLLKSAASIATTCVLEVRRNPLSS